VVSRDAHGRWGDWCNHLSWLRKSGPFRGLPIGSSLGFEFAACLPRVVLEGFEPQENEDVLGGIFVGWIQSPAVLVGQFKVGRGKVLACTLKLSDSFGSDPMATAILPRLISYVGSSTFRPKKQVEWRICDRVLLPTAETQPVSWRYTTERPPEGWEQPGFDDSAWSEGKAGFGTAGTPGTIIGTIWDGSDIWVRWRGELGEAADHAVLRLHHDEDAEVYINGQRALHERGYATEYEDHVLSAEAVKALAKGPVVIAAHCHQTVGGQYLDLGVRYSAR
jgi:hypothetical protein